MIRVRQYAGQNWLITPTATAIVTPPPVSTGGTHAPLGEAPLAATAGSQPAAPTTADQRWLIVLSGVAMVNFKGNSESQWRKETVVISPDIGAPINHAIARHRLPVPPGKHGDDFFRTFQAEQWAPFAALTSVFNKNQAKNFGFAVDHWRPEQFGERKDLTSSAILKNLWRGIAVDIALRDTDAEIFRMSYTISLIGRIVYVEPFGV